MHSHSSHCGLSFTPSYDSEGKSANDGRAKRDEGLARCKSLVYIAMQRREEAGTARGKGAPLILHSRTKRAGKTAPRASERTLSRIDRSGQPRTKKPERERRRSRTIAASDRERLVFTDATSRGEGGGGRTVPSRICAPARSGLWMARENYILPARRAGRGEEREGRAPLGSSGEIQANAKNVCRDFGRMRTNECGTRAERSMLNTRNKESFKKRERERDLFERAL